MNSSEFTVDRIDGEFVVLLKRPLEEEQILIPLAKLKIQLHEGDIVQLINNNEGTDFEITVLEKETSHAKDEIRSLIEKLKKK